MVSTIQRYLLAEVYAEMKLAQRHGLHDAIEELNDLTVGSVVVVSIIHLPVLIIIDLL
jgi:hypothetical protein